MAANLVAFECICKLAETIHHSLMKGLVFLVVMKSYYESYMSQMLLSLD